MRYSKLRKVLTVSAGAACLSVTSTTFAQSSVTLYGIIGVYIGSMKTSGSPAATIKEGGGGLPTSFWGMRGTEDLGGGYSAIFDISGFFQPNTGAAGRIPSDPFLSRDAYVGFKTPYGQVTFGRLYNPTYVSMASTNPFGYSVVFSPIILQSFIPAYGAAIFGDTVWNNSAQYQSPRVAGFMGTAIYSFGNVAGQTGVSNIGLHGDYTNGPFQAVVSGQRVREGFNQGASGQYAYLGGATYDFGIAKAFASFVGTSNATANTHSRGWQVGTSIPVTAFGKVLVEWMQTSFSGPRSAYAIRRTGGGGYDYFLSKRTDVYAIYLYDKMSGLGSGSSIAAGLRHVF